MAGRTDRTLWEPPRPTFVTILVGKTGVIGGNSERKGQDDVKAAALVSCIHKTEGAVLGNDGGSVLAIWNAPDPRRDHAVRACAAALKASEGEKDQRATQIGLHTADADVGSVLTGVAGAETEHYAATGHSVSVATAICRLNRLLGTRVLLSSETRREVDDRFVTRRVGDFKLLPGEYSITIYELVGPQGEEDKTQMARDEFANALQLFETGDFTEAELTFQRVLDNFPEDNVARFFLGEAEKVRANPPEDHWDGSVSVAERLPPI